MYNMCQKEGIIMSEKRKKFKELAEKRVSNAIKNIQNKKHILLCFVK